MVVMAVPFNWIVAPETNACPVTCKLTAVAPAVTLVGVIEVIDATGTGLTVNMNGVEVAALGEGFETVMEKVPVAVSNEAGIVV